MGSTDLDRDCDDFAPGFEQHVALNSGSLMWDSAIYDWDSDKVGRDSGDIPKGSGGLVRDSGGLARDSDDFVRGSGSLAVDSTVFMWILGVWRGIPMNGSVGVPAVWRGIPDGFSWDSGGSARDFAGFIRNPEVRRGIPTVRSGLQRFGTGSRWFRSGFRKFAMGFRRFRSGFRRFGAGLRLVRSGVPRFGAGPGKLSLESWAWRAGA